ncbi:MAG TPA: hypothetical protein VFM66_07070, partial [Agromyces sp.]|nr:hypothetical protein [Agromyces sp.]
MMPSGTEIGGRGELFVGATSSTWSAPAGRELARAMIVGAGEDSRVLVVRLEPDVDVVRVVVFVRIGSIVCAVRPYRDGETLAVELPFAVGRRSGIAVVVECETEDEAAELESRYEAQQATVEGGGGEGAAPPPEPAPPRPSPPPPGAPPPPATRTVPPLPTAEPPPVAAPAPDFEPEAAPPPAAAPEPDGEREPEPARRAIAHVHAEMPPRVQVDVPVDVRFRLSRHRLEATTGTTSTAHAITVDVARAVTVTIALRGFLLADDQPPTVSMRLPDAGDPPTEHRFRIIAPTAGRGEVSIVVRQDVDLPLATLRLVSEIVEPGASVTMDAAGVAAEVTPPDPELAALPTIRVDESIVGNDSTLRIGLTIDGEQYEYTKRLPDKARFIDTTYRRIAGIRDELTDVQDTRERGELGLRKLRALGMALARELLDDRAREILWNAQNAGLDGLMLQTGGELDVPWEIVHLTPPDDLDDDEKSRFLGEYGLTRWVYDTAHPTELRIARSRIRFVCPDYSEHRLRLTHTADERRLLIERFTAAPVDPDDADHLTALMQEGFDLLHFAGHGRWNEGSPQTQEVLLSAFSATDEVPGARYSDAQLRRDLPDRGVTDAAAAGPLVFLNACDLGRLP